MAINYIPVFAAPITFDKTKSYKAHTIVMDGNYIYVSKKDVAANSTITDTTVWFKIAANNAVLNTLTTTANAAKTAASTATTTANAAKTAADTATTTANAAKTAASTATTTANAAKTAASTAQDDCNNIKVALFSIPE